MPRFKDWKNLLNEQSKKDKSIIIDDLNIKLTRDIKIKFKCNCGKNDDKKIRLIIERSGFFCKICTNKRHKENIKKTKSLKTKEEIYRSNSKRKNTMNLKTKEELDKITNKRKNTWNLKTKEELDESNNKRKNTISLKTKEELDEIKKKRKNTMSSKTKEELEQIENKKKNTNFKKYGNEYFFKTDKFKFKSKNTLIKKYGVDNPMKSKEVRNIYTQTCFDKYGVRSHNQVKEIQSKKHKSNFLTKEYQFQTKEIVEVQGYEPFALKILEEQGYKYEDIKIEGIKIEYIFQDKLCVHFPDIYIPNENRIIEVKSTWTYNKKLERNIQKQNTSIGKGYKYEYWIFNQKKDLIIK